jgi:uncharacterized membrane-anchored protein YhcB (DUF1043 family)
MTEIRDQIGSSDIKHVAGLVGRIFECLESRREHTRNLRAEIPALESDWSAVERTVLSLGRRRTAIEAPLPPLPEPRGAAATKNWLEQRRVQGSRARDWAERLPAALAVLRSVNAFEAFGLSFPLPDADNRRTEVLRSQMREAILRQELPVMDSLLVQLQESLIRDGQRRTDLERIVASRAGEVASALQTLSQKDAAGVVPELQRWQTDAGDSVEMLIDALSLWDVSAARQVEARLNALADEVPKVRRRLEDDRRRTAAVAATLESACGELAAQRAKLQSELAADKLFRRSVLAAGGVLLGLTAVATSLTLDPAARWDGPLAMAMPIVLASVGAGIGVVVGNRRIRARHRAATEQTLSLDRQLASEARALAELREQVEATRHTLEWFRI